MGDDEVLNFGIVPMLPKGVFQYTLAGSDPRDGRWAVRTGLLQQVLTIMSDADTIIKRAHARGEAAAMVESCRAMASACAAIGSLGSAKLGDATERELAQQEELRAMLQTMRQLESSGAR